MPPLKEFRLNKKDVVWSYAAQFFSMGSGVITLPFILNKLSSNEIGLNYILLTVGSIISLVDLGFAPQFARNFTYVFSGAQEIRKEGVGRTTDTINYELLGYLLKTARYIYAILAVAALLLLIAVGTPYISKVTCGFSTVKNAFSIWIVYSFGTLFQIFYSYYYSMLLGAGCIKEQKISLICSKVTYIAILLILLYLEVGLLSVAIAQLIAPFTGRAISHHYFYTPRLKQQLSNHPLNNRHEILKILKALWYNAKRNAVIQIGSYAILRMSMFIAGLYLSLSEFASYGLMVQLTQLLGIVSCTFIQISQPKFASLRTHHNREGLLKDFAIALDIYYIIFITGSIFLVVFGNPILILIKSNTILPSRSILAIYCLIMFLEYNHSNFANLISSDNKIPFAPASIITGIAVCIGVYIFVRFTTFGVLGLILVQGICQAAYQNWRWPKMALNEFHISWVSLISIGGNVIRTKSISFVHKLININSL